MDKEPSILINGHQLADNQAATVRAALEHFASNLRDEGLGDDEHGQIIKRAYLERIDEIRSCMYKDPEGSVPKRAQVPM